MTIRCLKCDFENPSDTHFCGECGTKFSSPENVPVTATLEISKVKIASGTIFANRYKIIEELGEGGMGKVFRAFDKKIEEEVALKILRTEIATDETTIERFRNEGKFARKISHKNVCRVFDLNDEEGIPYITMEYVRGEDLKNLIKREGKISSEVAIRIAKQLCDGLAEAHMLGIVHRDLKPQNIMIDKHGNARIMDFGISRSLETKGVTKVGMIVGTPEYMSPEQVEGKDVDQRSDIYSLGVVFYEMVTGRVPFEGNAPFSIALKHTTQAPPDPKKFNVQISEDISYVILRCMEKDIEKRYQSVEDILSNLINIENGTPITSTPSRTYIPVPFISQEEEQIDVERPVFVAREEELEKLSTFLDDTLAGRGRVIFVTGEVGSGKTAMIQEFALRAQQMHSNLLIAGGNCNAHTGIGDPYLPFREILCLLTGDIEARWIAGAITKTQATRLWGTLRLSVQAIMDSGPDLIDTFVHGAALVARASSVAPAGAEWLARLKKVVERKAAGPTTVKPNQSDLLEQYTRFLLELVHKQPLLLILDDLQWADTGSISLLFHLCRRIESSRIMIVGAYRPAEVASGRGGERHPLESVINELQREFGDCSLELGQNGDREFLNAYLDTEPNKLGVEFRDTLYRQTKGHPLFTVELLRSMQKQRMLAKSEEGQWIEGPALDWEKLPSRVEAVVEERIGQLSNSLREVLTLASVEGEEFTGEVVARLQNVDDLEMVRLLSRELDKRHRLVNALGVQQTNGQRLSIYRFRHILFQKYLYNSLDDTERTYLHEKVGTVLETLYGDRAKEIAVQLALHFQKAGLQEKEIDYLERAGERALHGYANQEAVHFLSKAIALDSKLKSTRDSLTRARWEQKLGEAYLGLGVLEESHPHLQKAIAVLDRPVPTKSWRLAVAILRQVFLQSVHRLWPGKFVGRAKAKNNVLLAAARAYGYLAEVHYYTRQKFKAIYASLRALNLAESVGPSVELASNYSNMCIAAAVIPFHKLAQIFAHRAREIAKMVDPHSTLGYSLVTAGIYKLGVGQWAELDDMTNQALEIFEEVGEWRRWELAKSVQARSSFFQGDFKKSMRHYKDLYEMALRRGDRQDQVLGLQGQAMIQLRLGNIQKVLHLLKVMDFETLSDEFTIEKLWAYAILAQAKLYLGESQPAQEAAERALRMFAQSDPRVASAVAYICVTEVLLRLCEYCKREEAGRSEYLMSLARQACKALKRYARVFTISRPSSLLFRGLYNWLAGKPQKALKAWKKSLACSRKLGMPYEEGLVHYEIGRHSKDPKRTEHLSIASKISSKLGANYDLPQAKDALK